MPEASSSPYQSTPFSQHDASMVQIETLVLKSFLRRIRRKTRRCCASRSRSRDAAGLFFSVPIHAVSPACPRASYLDAFAWCGVSGMNVASKTARASGIASRSVLSAFTSNLYCAPYPSSISLKRTPIKAMRLRGHAYGAGSARSVRAATKSDGHAKHNFLKDLANRDSAVRKLCSDSRMKAHGYLV